MIRMQKVAAQNEKRLFEIQVVPKKLPKTKKVDYSVPLTRHDPKDLGLICLVKKRKIRFRIFLDLKILSWGAFVWDQF